MPKDYSRFKKVERSSWKDWNNLDISTYGESAKNK